jgi:uncharacterized protein (TIGR02996 family)
MAKKGTAAGASVDKGFLADILANPRDDAPRLVFADWLEEHGQAERAEFIRAQIELAGLGDDPDAGVALRQRATELLREHGKEWMKDLPAWTRRQSVWFRRGFVSGLSSAALPFIKGSKGLVARIPLESLVLRTVAPHLRALTDCPDLAGIVELNLTDQLGSNLPSLRTLLSSAHLGRLRILWIDSATLGAPGAEVLVSASGLANLAELHLVGTALEDRGVRRLAAAPWSKGCRVLRLIHAGASFTPAVVETLASFAALEELDLSFNSLSPAGAVALASTFKSPLSRLELRGTRPGRRGLAALAASGALRALRWLDLDDCQLGDESIEALECPNLASLIGLNLYNNRLTDRAAKLLAAMPNLASLRALDIGLSEIGDEGAAALARSPWLGSLTWLNILYSRIGEKGRTILRDRFGDRLRFDFPGRSRGQTNLPGAIS